MDARRRWRRTSVLAFVLLAGSGVRAPVALTVDNKSSLDITVYVIHDAKTSRLDRVEAVRKKRLVIPHRMVGVLGDLRLVGEREGAREGFGGRIVTQSVTTTECQRLEWTIEARLELSSLGVFPVDSCGGAAPAAR